MTNPLLSEELSKRIWGLIEPVEIAPWPMEQRKEYEMVSEDAAAFLKEDTETRADTTHFRYRYLHDDADENNVPVQLLCETILQRAEAYKTILRVYRTVRRRTQALIQDDEELLHDPLRISELDDFITEQLRDTLQKYS